MTSIQVPKWYDKKYIGFKDNHLILKPNAPNNIKKEFYKYKLEKSKNNSLEVMK